MPNTASAIRRVRRVVKQTAVNRLRKSKYRAAVKKMEVLIKAGEKDKIKIIKSLWRIIYSNRNADMYETNLMRRLSGLLYIDSKTMGDIKEQIKKENS